MNNKTQRKPKRVLLGEGIPFWQLGGNRNYPYSVGLTKYGIKDLFSKEETQYVALCSSNIPKGTKRIRLIAEVIE